MQTIFRIITLLCLLFTGDSDSSDFSNRWDYKLTPSQNTTKLYGSNNSDLLCFTAVCNIHPWAISIYEADYQESTATGGVCSFVYNSSTTVAMCNCTTDLSRSPADLCINITMLRTPKTLNISVKYQDEMESYTISKINNTEMGSSTSIQNTGLGPYLSPSFMSNNDSLSYTPSSTNAPSPSGPFTTTPSGPSTTSSSGSSTTTTSRPSTPGNYAAGSHNPTLGITFIMTMLVLFL